jgi:hypothetical protein
MGDVAAATSRYFHFGQILVAAFEDGDCCIRVCFRGGDCRKKTGGSSANDGDFSRWGSSAFHDFHGCAKSLTKGIGTGNVHCHNRDPEPRRIMLNQRNFKKNRPEI